MDKTIYSLKLHEILEVPTKGAGKIEITRVAGGWIYAIDFPGYRQSPSVFVPFNSEFMEVPKFIKKLTK